MRFGQWRVGSGSGGGGEGTMAEGLCGPSEGCSNVLCTGACTPTAAEAGGCGEAGMEDAAEKEFLLLEPCISQFLNV